MVTLIADGKRMSQPIKIVMDPRVKTPKAALEQQYSLSMKCYRGLNEIFGTIRQIRALRNRIQALSAGVSDAALKDSLSSLDKKLKSWKGDGVPDMEDLAYISVDGADSVKETFNGLQTKLLYLMLSVQSADVKPTSVQTASFRKEEQVFKGIMNMWKSFLATGLNQINTELKSHGLEALTIE